MKKDTEKLTTLYSLFWKLNYEFFGGILPAIELGFSNRLKTTGGMYFKSRTKKIIPKIQISHRYFEMESSWKEIHDTLGHEMVHYWLDFQGKPCGHNALFHAKMQLCGFSRYSRLKPAHAHYVYACPGCGIKYYRRKKGTWSCGPCSGKKFNPKFALEILSYEMQRLP